MLQRSLESLDGSSTTWQVILPERMRKQFLSVIHGRMNDGCLSRRQTAASVQSRAYWPSWLSDLNAFLKERQPCSWNYRKSALRKAHFRTLRKSGRMAPRKLFHSHEVNRSIDVMELPPDKTNVVTTTRDGYDNLRNDAVEVREKPCSSVKKRKRCLRPTPAIRVSNKFQ